MSGYVRTERATDTARDQALPRAPSASRRGVARPAPDPPRPGGGAPGVALVAVLIAVAVGGLLSFSLVFLATLDTLGARAAAEAALAAGQRDGAVALATEAVLDAWAQGRPVPVGRLGPWPAAGIRATADVTAPTPDEARIDVRATVGRSTLRRRVALVRDGSGSVRVVGWE